MRSLALMIMVAGFLASCGTSEPPEPASDTAEVDAVDVSAPEEIPNRSDEIERDEGSHPAAVFDFIGIEPGDAVADLFAGNGYNTYLLSERVGPEGSVYAQGYSPGLRTRTERGDLAGAENVALVDSLSNLPDGALDAVIVVRGYHLFANPTEFFATLQRSLKPGGVVGIVEVRLGRPHGHDMDTHRMGEGTVIDAFEEAGFDYVGESEILYNPDDPRTEFWPGRRHLTDRMLLKFAKPGEPAADVPATALSTP